MNSDHHPFSLSMRLETADETADLARRIGKHLGPGDVILLTGPIGAGKTHFARSLIQARLAALGLSEDVPSPTFTLVQVYDTGVEIWHADLYRLTNADEVVELGLDEAFQGAICLVEWPDRLGNFRPTGALEMSFVPDPSSDARLMQMFSDDVRWKEVFAKVLA